MTRPMQLVGAAVVVFQLYTHPGKCDQVQVNVVQDFHAHNEQGEKGPSTGVLLAADGYLYGTVLVNSSQDSKSFGGIFRVKPDGTDYHMLAYFNGNVNGSDKQHPRGAYPTENENLIQKNGIIYGTTLKGGTDDSVYNIADAAKGGTIFCFDPSIIDPQNPKADVYVLADFKGWQNNGIVIPTDASGNPLNNFGSAPLGSRPGDLMQRDNSDPQIYGSAAGSAFFIFKALSKPLNDNSSVNISEFVIPNSNNNHCHQLLEDANGNILIMPDYQSGKIALLKFPVQGNNYTPNPIISIKDPDGKLTKYGSDGVDGDFLGAAAFGSSGKKLYVIVGIPAGFPNGAIYELDMSDLNNVSAKLVVEFNGMSDDDPSGKLAGLGTSYLFCARDGRLYGVTWGDNKAHDDPTHINGTIFQLTASSSSSTGWTGNTLYTFGNFFGPQIGFAEDMEGHIYGTAFFGSLNGSDGGLVYSFLPPPIIATPNLPKFMGANRIVYGEAGGTVVYIGMDGHLHIVPWVGPAMEITSERAGSFDSLSAATRDAFYAATLIAMANEVKDAKTKKTLQKLSGEFVNEQTKSLKSAADKR